MATPNKSMKWYPMDLTETHRQKSIALTIQLLSHNLQITPAGSSQHELTKCK